MQAIAVNRHRFPCNQTIEAGCVLHIGMNLGLVNLVVIIYHIPTLSTCHGNLWIKKGFSGFPSLNKENEHPPPKIP
jgi:hypothetical protein